MDCQKLNFQLWAKDKSKNLVGQPLFKQSVKMLPKDEFDLVYVHRPFVAQCHQGTIEKIESIFDRSVINTDTFDKPFDLMWVVIEGRRPKQNAG